MKKKIILFLFMLCLIIPTTVQAEVSIHNTSLLGINQKKVGEELPLDFNINFSGLETGTDKTFGVWQVIYELNFDPNVFAITGITSPGWDSAVVKMDNQYYVYSSVNGETSSNKCANGSLYCGDYTATLSFFVKNTEESSSIIQVGDVGVFLLDMVDPEKEYTQDDAIEIDATANKKITVRISKSSTTVKEPESIVTTKKPTSTITKPSTSSGSSTTNKSSNNYLSLLEIENHEITFDKKENSYDVTVDKGVNELKIKAETEDKKATYKVYGADDLAKSDYKVQVAVTSESGELNIYKIEVSEKQTPVAAVNKLKKIKIDSKYFIIGGSVLGGIVLIAIIVNLINNHKIKKALKHLDEL